MPCFSRSVVIKWCAPPIVAVLPRSGNPCGWAGTVSPGDMKRGHLSVETVSKVLLKFRYQHTSDPTSAPSRVQIWVSMLSLVLVEYLRNDTYRATAAGSTNEDGCLPHWFLGILWAFSDLFQLKDHKKALSLVAHELLSSFWCQECCEPRLCAAARQSPVVWNLYQQKLGKFSGQPGRMAQKKRSEKTV